MLFLRRRSYFRINGNLCQTHKICYKCLTWNIYNLYIKYTLSGFDNFSCYWFYFHGPQPRQESMEDELFFLHCIAYDNVFVDGRKSTRHPVYRKFICHPVDLVEWGTHESYHGCRTTLLKQMFSSNSVERNLSINPYFIILACDAKSASSLTTIKHELVFKECSHDSDFMVWSTVQ
jgi:hypothetical protein